MEHGHPNRRTSEHLDMLRSCIAETFTATCWTFNLLLQIANFVEGETSISFFIPFVLLGAAIIALSVMNARRNYIRLKEFISRMD